MKVYTLQTTLFLVGATVGAGFLSGAELVRFFPVEEFLFPLAVSSFAFFLFLHFFLSLGKKYGGYEGATRRLFGRAAPFFRVLISLTALIPAAGMLAGLDSLFPRVQPLLSLSGLALSLFLLKRGIKGLSLFNALLVPVLLVLTLYCSRGGTSFSYPIFASPLKGFAGGVLYASMNAFLALPVLMEAGKGEERTALPAFFTALLVFSIAARILARVYYEGADALRADMPFLYIAGGNPLFFAATACAIFTSLGSSIFTLLSAVRVQKNGKSNRERAAKGGILLAAFLLSRFGFRDIVELFYPVLGLFGLLFSAFAVFHEQFFKEYDKEVHSRRQKAENTGCAHHEVELKGLPAVYNEVAEPRPRNDVFAHDRTDPRHADVHFEHGNEGGKRGRNNELKKDLQFGGAHRLHEE